jgi:sec-independent protein translocase protein TatC
VRMPFRLGRSRSRLDAADMTLVGHLSELRTRLIRSVLAVVIGAAIVYIFNERIFDFLQAPYCDLKEAKGQECQFLIRSPMERFQVVLSMSGYGGMILALPVVLYQLAKFVLPGLYPQERKLLTPFVAASVVLLLLGITSGYLLMPKTLSVLGSFGPESFTELFSPKEYISFFVKMLLAFGLAAELPLVLVFLQLIGIVKPSTLKKNRRIAGVVVVFLAAIITPTGDPFTLLVLAIPMYLFYEIAIIVGSRLTKGRQPALDS